MGSKGLACHSVILSITLSVTFEINVAETSASYISLKAATISRVLKPLERVHDLDFLG
jgi:hypothetical protein